MNIEFLYSRLICTCVNSSLSINSMACSSRDIRGSVWLKRYMRMSLDPAVARITLLSLFSLSLLYDHMSRLFLNHRAPSIMV